MQLIQLDSTKNPKCLFVARDRNFCLGSKRLILLINGYIRQQADKIDYVDKQSIVIHQLCNIIITYFTSYMIEFKKNFRKKYDACSCYEMSYENKISLLYSFDFNHSASNAIFGQELLNSLQSQEEKDKLVHDCLYFPKHLLSFPADKGAMNPIPVPNLNPKQANLKQSDCHWCEEWNEYDIRRIENSNYNLLQLACVFHKVNTVIFCIEVSGYCDRENEKNNFQMLNMHKNNIYGETAFYIACKYQAYKCIELLLCYKHCLDINLTANDGTTSLNAAFGDPHYCALQTGLLLTNTMIYDWFVGVGDGCNDCDGDKSNVYLECIKKYLFHVDSKIALLLLRIVFIKLNINNVKKFQSIFGEMINIWCSNPKYIEIAQCVAQGGNTWSDGYDMKWLQSLNIVF